MKKHLDSYGPFFVYLGMIFREKTNNLTKNIQTYTQMKIQRVQ